MKRIFAPVLSLLMVFSAVSCNQEPDYSDMKGVLGLTSLNTPETGVFEVTKGQQKTVNIKVTAESICGSTLDIIVGADPALVEAYNTANGTSYEMLPTEAFTFADAEVMLPRFNTVSSVCQLNLVGRGCIENQEYILPVVISTVEGSENYELSQENSVLYIFFKMLPPLKGTGTQDDPYLIMEVDDLLEMNDKLVSGEMKYFKMTTDIDMSEDSDYFMPINATKPYDKIVHFDGQGHTISNLNTASGFFRVFFGTIENVVFDNCNVNTTANDRAVVADFFGYADGDTYSADKYLHNRANNVAVKNSSMTSTAQRATIFAAQAFNATFENIYLENCDVVGARRSGVLIAKDIAPITVDHCYVKGGTLAGPQQMGGIIGEMVSNSTVKNTGVSIDFNCQFGTGGIIGQCTSSAAVTYTVQNCFVWGEQLSTAIDGSDTAAHYSCGAIVGCMAAAEGVGTYNLSNCYYKPDYQFIDYYMMMTQNLLVDRADISGNRVGTPSYNYPYHGKAAPAGKSASQMAKDFTFDETLWDLSGAEPTLKLAQ